MSLTIDARASLKRNESPANAGRRNAAAQFTDIDNRGIGDSFKIPKKNPNDLISIKDAAELAGLATFEVRNLAKEESVEKYEIAGTEFYSKSDIDELAVLVRQPNEYDQKVKNFRMAYMYETDDLVCDDCVPE